MASSALSSREGVGDRSPGGRWWAGWGSAGRGAAVDSSRRGQPVDLSAPGTERPDLDERLVAVGRRLDRERRVDQQVAEHLDDEQLVVHEQDAGPRLGGIETRQ